LQEAQEGSVTVGKILATNLREIACSSAGFEPMARPAGFLRPSAIRVSAGIVDRREKIFSVPFSYACFSFRFLRIFVQSFQDDFAEDFAGADVVQSDVTFDRGLDVAMTEDLSDQLVVTWMVLQNDGPGSMSELMCRYPQTSEFADPLGYLTAERDLAL
jgi:hypothetical protein